MAGGSWSCTFTSPSAFVTDQYTLTVYAYAGTGFSSSTITFRIQGPGMPLAARRRARQPQES
jgi:hypothetical protein